jgi:hypothetical protein
MVRTAEATVVPTQRRVAVEALIGGDALER